MLPSLSTPIRHFERSEESAFRLLPLRGASIRNRRHKSMNLSSRPEARAFCGPEWGDRGKLAASCPTHSSIQVCHPEHAFCAKDLNRSVRRDQHDFSCPLPDICSVISDTSFARSPFHYSRIPATIYRATTYSPDPALWCYYRSIRLAPHGISRCLGGHA